MIQIKELLENKGAVCDEILHSLPEWFGIEKSIQNYIIEVEKLPTFVAYSDEKTIGFLSLKIHNPCSAEIYVMGVKKDFHRKGVGKRLLQKAEEYLRKNRFHFLTVKTLSPSAEDENYAKTRVFYQSMGFYPLEEFKTFWDENNPCLFMIKVLK